MKGRVVDALTVMMLLPVVDAAPLVRELPVSANIVVNQVSPGLDIVANESVFILAYSTGSQQFLPLDILFKVRSISGLSVAYNLSLSQLGGRCDAIPLVPVSTLDGADMGLNQPRRFSGIENTHVLTLSFPSLSQTSLAQQCEGDVGVIAELTV